MPPHLAQMLLPTLISCRPPQSLYNSKIIARGQGYVSQALSWLLFWSQVYEYSSLNSSNHASLNSFPPRPVTSHGVIMVMGIYMGSLVLGDILVLQYNGFCFFQLFLMGVRELLPYWYGHTFSIIIAIASNALIFPASSKLMFIYKCSYIYAVYL